MPNSIENPPNSIWPNGLKLDSEEYVIFYPLGTNKVDIATVTWPEGDKLVSPYVYQNDKLVGFVDTKALIVSGTATTTMNYNHIEADFASISEGTLTVNAPNATIKKFTWSVVDSGDNDESFDFVIIDFTITDQETIDTVRTAYRVVDKTIYTEDGSVIGTWDTSKIEVGGIYDPEGIKDGLFCNLDANNGTARGFTLSEFNSDLSSLRNGSLMFYNCTNLTSFSPDLSSLTDGYSMFRGCSQLTSFSSNLSSLTNGDSMFHSCTNLTIFTSDLSSLTNGDMMFFNCDNLTSFTSDLPNLTIGYNMFQSCDKLTSFSSDLSNLTDGQYMFYWCENLTSFSSDLSNLTDGNHMFDLCSQLTLFSSNLPNLTNGQYMFDGCKLDAPSVKNIIDTINTYNDRLTLGIGCNNTTEDKNLFAQEVGYSGMTSLLAALEAKGWTVTAQYNGRPTTTYGLRRPSENTLPVFVKLEEVEETEDHPNYTSEDGAKKYMLNWFHETTGSTEGYTKYATLEEAIEALNIKPIERN